MGIFSLLGEVIGDYTIMLETILDIATQAYLLLFTHLLLDTTLKSICLVA